ncbi:hypothetical protein Peur_052238 [Populus x canadensis]
MKFMSYATIVVTYNCVSVAYSSQVRARASRFFKPLDEPKDKENPGMGYILALATNSDSHLVDAFGLRIARYWTRVVLDYVKLKQIAETFVASLVKSCYIFFFGNDDRRNNVSIHMLMK